MFECGSVPVCMCMFVGVYICMNGCVCIIFMYVYVFVLICINQTFVLNLSPFVWFSQTTAIALVNVSIFLLFFNLRALFACVYMCINMCMQFEVRGYMCAFLKCICVCVHIRVFVVGNLIVYLSV